MAEWEHVLVVPEGTVLTDETIDSFVQAFNLDGSGKERTTNYGTYPPEEPWETSRYQLPESESFGTKRIPGANPFYFVNQKDSQGGVYAHFGNLDDLTSP